jgi:hypothetical protein
MLASSTSTVCGLIVLAAARAFLNERSTIAMSPECLARSTSSATAHPVTECRVRYTV